MSRVINSSLGSLAPPQRFMYEYGCFVCFWGNFDLMMEALIWHLSKACSPSSNCRAINKLASGAKRGRLTPLLKSESPEAVAALDHLFSVAERNDWVHGVVLNPNGDFSVLTRFRAYSNHEPFRVENVRIDFDSSPFQDFYEAYQRFEREVDRSLGLNTVGMCNQYIRAVQGV